jgi:hypothetical protein
MCEDSMLTIFVTKSEEWDLENQFCVIRLNESVRDAGIMTAWALVSQFRILLGVWAYALGFLNLFVIEARLWAVDPYKNSYKMHKRSCDLGRLSF